MNIKIEKSWNNKLNTEFQKEYFLSLVKFLNLEYIDHVVFPPVKLIFNAFDRCAFDDVKVVILGQDPYHGLRQAHGLAFSVPPGTPKPPSLKNIFKELNSDLGVSLPESGSLLRWAAQGVLLLNATLTVRQGDPGSHHGRGWELFTDAVINEIVNQREHVVFMLWGAYAQKKCIKINRNKHLVIKTSHPSPLSANRSFLGSKQFSYCNNYLVSHKKQPIDW